MALQFCFEINWPLGIAKGFKKMKFYDGFLSYLQDKRANTAHQQQQFFLSFLVYQVEMKNIVKY